MKRVTIKEFNQSNVAPLLNTWTINHQSDDERTNNKKVRGKTVQSNQKLPNEKGRYHSVKQKRESLSQTMNNGRPLSSGSNSFAFDPEILNSLMKQFELQGGYVKAKSPKNSSF